MNRPIASTLLSIAALISVIVAWQWEARIKAPAAPGRLERKPPQNKKEAMVVPSDLAWGKLSDEELREVMSFFGEEKSPHSFRWTTKVAIGESVITEAYEGRPGEFVFNKLTPRLEGQRDGRDLVVIEAAIFTINLTGEQKTVLDCGFGMSMRRGQGAESKGVMHGREGDYTIKGEVTVLDGGTSVFLDASGGFEPRTKGSLLVD